MKVWIEFEDGERADISRSIDGRWAAARVGARRRKGWSNQRIALEIGGDVEAGKDGLIGWACGARFDGDDLVLDDCGPVVTVADMDW